MTYSLLSSLEKNSLITVEQVTNMRMFIAQKYESHPSDYQARILANTIRSIIDKDLIMFATSLVKDVQKHLFEFAVVRSKFYIDARDMYEALLQVNLVAHKMVSHLKLWVKGKVPPSEVRDAEQAIDKDLVKYGYTPSPSPQSPLSDVETKHGYRIKWDNLIIYGLFILACTLVVMALFSTLNLRTSQPLSQEISSKSPMVIEGVTESSTYQDLSYKAIDPKALVNWLDSKSSYLATKDAVATLIKVARHEDLNPLVLVAIMGQEQNFVPTSHPQAHRIANNPFNVHGSWVKYNTSLEDTALIAAKTVKRLEKDPPQNMDVFEWVNREYAEDTSWWQGVRFFMNDLEGAGLYQLKP